MKNISLLVMAAGMGSRFGGLKQITPVDGQGNFIIDYSIYDALSAGFNHVVFVIKKEFEPEFRETVGVRTEELVRASYVFQDVQDVPEGYKVPGGRTKPWGTTHAVLAAKNAIDGPFSTLNADDFYGREVYTEMYNALAALPPGTCCLPGYELNGTLSEMGGVSRGICRADGEGRLLSIEEHHKVMRDGKGTAAAENSAGVPVTLALDSPASMNMFGFGADIFAEMEREFRLFLDNLKDPAKEEFYLPEFVGRLIEQGRLEARVWRTKARWSGVTHKSDLDDLVRKIAEHRKNGIYPEKLSGGGAR